MNDDIEQRRAMHHTARNLWPHQINAVECHDTLLEWYLSCREFADDIIAQIEAEDIAQMKHDDWKRIVTGYLIGAKKNMRLIERRAVAIGAELPSRRSDHWRKRVAELEQQAAEQRQFERTVITDWLVAQYGARGSEIAEEIIAKEHHIWRREQRDGVAA
jgi:hypothetical protein